ncbi:MAG: beta-eliminating lyase-related protein [Boseongicola sp.]
MNFASDNSGPVHPKVMEALVRANDGYAMPYGSDPLTARAIEKVREVFEAPDAAVFLVATGSAANSLCIATFSRPWDTVFCARFAHSHVDECNAPEFFAGGIKITTVGKEDDKFTADELEVAIKQWDPANIQNPAHGPVSITQVTERGTLYSLDEMSAISRVAKAHGLALHLDGARFANAAVALGCTAAEMSWRAGVDAVSFGGTKNGLMGVEAVVIFDRDNAVEFARRRKRGAHLFSKTRYLAAQMDAYLTDGLWRETATAANAATARLAAGFESVDGGKLAFTPQANMIYVWMPRTMHRRLTDEGVNYYIEQGKLEGEDPDEMLLGRFVCDWSTTVEGIDQCLEIAQA